MPRTEDSGAQVGHDRGDGLRWFLTNGPGAVVALVTGVVTLMFTLFPDLKPFTPTHLSARVSVVSVERAVSRDQWRWRKALGDPAEHERLVRADFRALHRPKSEPCESLGEEPGYLVYVAVVAEGYKAHQLALRAAVYDAATHRRFRDSEEFRQVARVPVDAPTARSLQLIWLWAPTTAKRHYIQIELYDLGNHLLDMRKTAGFPALSDEELTSMPTSCKRD